MVGELINLLETQGQEGILRHFLISFASCVVKGHNFLFVNYNCTVVGQWIHIVDIKLVTINKQYPIINHSKT